MQMHKSISWTFEIDTASDKECDLRIWRQSPATAAFRVRWGAVSVNDEQTIVSCLGPSRAAQALSCLGSVFLVSTL